MAYRDPAVRRQRDRERIAQRTAARIEAGLCARCGKTEPLPERRLCAPCNDKRNAASRARDARLRAEGKPRRDPAQAKLYERERSRQVHAERKAVRHLHQVRPRPGAPRAHDLRALRRAAPRARPRPSRQGEGRGRPLWRTRSRGPAPCRPEAQPPAQRGPQGSRPVHPLRATSRPRRAGRCASRAARTGGPAKRDAPCRAPRRRVVRPLRNAPAPGGKAYCEPCAKARSKRRNLEAKREADRRRYAERRARGDCTSMRQAGQRGGRVPGLLRRRPRPLRRPPGRRGLRQVPGSHLRRHGLLRSLRRGQGRAPRPRGGIRRPARPLCRPAGQGALRRLRCAVAGGGALRALFAQAPRELGGVSRHSDLGPELDGDRDRHRPGARPV